MDIQGFYAGKIFDAYEWLGAHLTEAGVVFRTFAPNAKEVSVLWKEKTVPMKRVYDNNFFEAVIGEAKEGDTYEFRIRHRDGSYQDHCDPYGYGMELRPAHKSIVRDLKAYHFSDEEWMKNRSDRKNGPMHIYEMHLGSWRRKKSRVLEEKEPGRKVKTAEEEKGAENPDWYRYEELAEPLIAYLKESGYNYVEFLPLSEHPCDESWGYQNTGFFAPTSRYGDLNGLKKLIDLLHQNQIGVILDFVPVHFAVDAYGLALYDGNPLYEYPYPDVGISEWGSYNFMHSRNEVRSFLQSAAHYWLKEYHFDGLRMDAISRIIYWHGNEQRGVNKNAVEFLTYMNQGLKKRNPGCLLAAEDSSSFQGVTAPIEEGGLGFDYKWDMGWMHDTLKYFQTPPQKRKESYHKLTFSMYYYYNERFLLPFSHDEVVHEKGTILQKMYGDREDKFSQARALYLYMMVHPGKKLNFMGNEIGQLREWDEKREQDWLTGREPDRERFYHFMKDLNHLYLHHPALFERDYEKEGFCWLDCQQEERCIYAILRKSKNEKLIAFFNFSDKMQTGYGVELPDVKKVEMLLNTEMEKYGGEIPEKADFYTLYRGKLYCTLMPYSGVLFHIGEEITEKTGSEYAEGVRTTEKTECPEEINM